MGLKLSEILSKIKDIQKLDFDSSVKPIQNYITGVNNSLTDCKLININDLFHAQSNLNSSLIEYKNIVEKIENKLLSVFKNNHEEYLKISDDLYKLNLDKMLFEEHLHWASLWPPSGDEFNFFYQTIKKHVDWRYPGLIVGSKNSKMIRSLVGTEPLYIMERYHNYFKLQKDKFNIEHTRKLKFYTFDEVNFLPENSLGIAAIYNEFNFLPWGKVKNFLSVLSRKMMPGGILIFNFNDCNTVRGFIEFENQSMSYTTSEMFENFLSKYDFSCIKKYNSESQTFSFLVFQLKGEKNLIKKHPAIGYIRQQPFQNVEQEKRLKIIRKLINDSSK